MDIPCFISNVISHKRVSIPRTSPNHCAYIARQCVNLTRVEISHAQVHFTLCIFVTPSQLFKSTWDVSSMYGLATARERENTPGLDSRIQNKKRRAQRAAARSGHIRRLTSSLPLCCRSTSALPSAYRTLRRKASLCHRSSTTAFGHMDR